MKPTKDDIERNFEHVLKGEPLDMPLAVLDGELKRKCYIEANKDKIAKQKKSYYQANKDRLAKQMKAYREANKDKIKAYYQANKDRLAKQQKAYREANKDRLAKQQKAYYQNITKPKLLAFKKVKA